MYDNHTKTEMLNRMHIAEQLKRSEERRRLSETIKTTVENRATLLQQMKNAVQNLQATQTQPEAPDYPQTTPKPA